MEAEKETLSTYSKIAEEWTAAQIPNFWDEEYAKFFDYLPSGKILDLGCGSGRDSLWFTEKHYEYVGIDISDEMIKLAKAKNPKASFLVKSFYDLDFTPENFDGFWAACSFLHVPKEKIKDLLGKVKRVLKPGAIGFIAVKEGSGEKMVEWQNSGQKRFFSYYTQDEFEKLLEVGKFEVLEKFRREPIDSDQDGVFLVFYVKAV